MPNLQAREIQPPTGVSLGRSDDIRVGGKSQTIGAWHSEHSATGVYKYDNHQSRRRAFTPANHLHNG